MVTTRHQHSLPKQCSSCWEKKPSTAFPSKTPTTHCDHDIQTCTDCMHTWIATKLNSLYQPSSAIQCPDCDLELLTQSIVENTTLSTFQKFSRTCQRITQSLQPDARWCLNPGCEWIRRVDSQDEIWKCEGCGAWACVQCERPYHEEESCEEYARRNMGRLVEENLTARVIASLRVAGTIKGCPNCSCPMMKDGKTPDKVMCPRCRYKFDWKAA